MPRRLGIAVVLLAVTALAADQTPQEVGDQVAEAVGEEERVDVALDQVLGRTAQQAEVERLYARWQELETLKRSEQGSFAGQDPCSDSVFQKDCSDCLNLFANTYRTKPSFISQIRCTFKRGQS
jgi:hypothetical protein